MQFASPQKSSPILRIRLLYVVILLLSVLVVARLFYLQVIQHQYYQTAALAGQLKEYEIPSSRGIIEAYDGDAAVPLVLNEYKYTLFLDPEHIDTPEDTAEVLRSVYKQFSSDELVESMQQESRYVVLEKKLSKDQADAIEALELPGVGLRQEPYRAYPQGQLAAHVLGFVNDEGEGVYGVEQALNNTLSGKPGQLRAITDARGVPLASNPENILVQPKDGERIRLSIDVNLQRQMEDIISQRAEDAESPYVGAVVLHAETGKIRAMANYPTFDPARFFEAEAKSEGDIFQNDIVAAPLEIGSIMKPLTLAAALDAGVVSRETTFNDPDRYVIDGSTVVNVEESSGGGVRSMEDILRLSLNTGATWILQQLGGGEINSQARNTWHHYLTERYRFDDITGIEQGYEVPGSIPDPDDGFGLNIQYANTAFGQGMTATPLQVAAAYGAMLNGGIYYRPSIVAGSVQPDGSLRISAPEVVRENVVSKEASSDVKQLMNRAFEQNYRSYRFQGLREGYTIGGKTGTAQIPNPAGGYFTDTFNGTFAGFVAGEEDTYIIVVRIDEPQTGGYAGTVAAGPIFSGLAEAILDANMIEPKM